VDAGKPRRRYWPVFVVLALFALTGYGIWNRQRTAHLEAASTLSEEQERRLKRETEIEFKSADTNGDGYLSPDEVRGRFPVIAREFQRVDKDGDGRISPREFLQARQAMLERRLNRTAN
jgi:hypothetical protein